MAQMKSITVYECDGCGYPVKADNKGGVPKGFHGTVGEKHPDGDSGPVEFYAHSDRCIKKAIMKVLGLN